MSSHVCLVELFSMPGAGKTTLAAGAAKRQPLTTRGELSANWRESSTFTKALIIARSLLDLPLLIAAAHLALAAPLRTRESVFRLGRLLAKADWIRSQRGLLLLDQGFLQDLWSVLYSAGHHSARPELVAPMVRKLYRGLHSRIAFIDIDPATAAARICSRSDGDSRFDGMPEKELMASLAAAARLPSDLISAARDAGLNIERLDGRATPSRLSQRLNLILTECLQSGFLNARL